jgi:hypothetical protein
MNLIKIRLRLYRYNSCSKSWKTSQSLTWIKATRLSELFYEKYGVLPETVAKAQGCRDGLRSLIKSSKRFSIYGTPIPQEFYVALFQVVAPAFQQSQSIPLHCRIKQRSKVDRRLSKPLQVGSTRENQLDRAQKLPEHQASSFPPIQSVNDLEVALIAIAKSLVANHPQNSVSIGRLSRKFCDYYMQPIRVVMRSICPDLKLIELLQVIPSLQVQKVEADWQVTVEADSME